MGVRELSFFKGRWVWGFGGGWARIVGVEGVVVVS